MPSPNNHEGSSGTENLILCQEPNIWLGDESSFRKSFANQVAVRNMWQTRGVDISLYSEADREEDGENQFGYMTDVVGDLGLLYINGTLVSEYSPYNRYYGDVSYDEIRNSAVELINNHGVKAILGVYKTSGGSAVGISASAEFMKDMEAAGVPFYAYADTMMMSGGYWHAASARKIFSERMAMSGSIGVITIHMGYKGYLDKLGIVATVMRKGEFKALGTPYENLSEKAKGELEGQMGTIYDMFLDHVGEHRKLSRQHLLEEAAEGRVFMGQDAVRVGLADGVMTFDKTVKYLLQELESGKNASVSISASSFNLNHQLQGDDMKKRRLNEAGLGAVASGISEEVALKDPALSEEVSETETETGKGSEAAKPAAAPEPKAEETAPAPAPVTQAPSAAVDSSVIDRLVSVSSELAVAKAKIQELTDSISLIKTESNGLRQIAVSAINRMLPALGHSQMKADESVNNSFLISRWEQVNTEFLNRFPGSARAVSASDQDQAASEVNQQPQSAPLSAVSIGGRKKNRN